MGHKCCVFFFTRLLFSKICCKISVVYLLPFLRRCVCMKEIKLLRSYIRGSLISCETIQTAVMLSDRQPGLNYGRFSTSPACNVFSDLQRLHTIWNLSCVCIKGGIPLAQQFELFCRQRTLSEESNPCLLYRHSSMI